MKARVKATGEIVEVEPTFVDGNKIYSWVTNNGYFHTSGSLDFDGLTEELTYVKEKSFPKDEPDYWEKLKHQYAGMAMQAILSNNNLLTALCNGNKEVLICKKVSDNANIIATALVDRLKEEEK